jgi:hypothetical protein
MTETMPARVSTEPTLERDKQQFEKITNGTKGKNALKRLHTVLEALLHLHRNKNERKPEKFEAYGLKIETWNYVTVHEWVERLLTKLMDINSLNNEEYKYHARSAIARSLTLSFSKNHLVKAIMAMSILAMPFEYAERKRQAYERLVSVTPHGYAYLTRKGDALRLTMDFIDVIVSTNLYKRGDEAVHLVYDVADFYINGYKKIVEQMKDPNMIVVFNKKMPTTLKSNALLDENKALRRVRTRKPKDK